MNLNNRVGGKADFASLRTLLPLFSGRRRQVWTIAALAGLSGLCTIMMFFVIGRSVGALTSGPVSDSRIVLLVLGVFATGVGGAVAGHLQAGLAADVAADVSAELQGHTFDRRVHDSLVNVTANPAGRITNTILHDLPLVPTFLLNSVAAAASALATLLAVVGAVSYVNPQLLGVLAILAVLVWPYRAIERRMRDAAVRKIQSMASLHMFLEQWLTLAGVKFARNLGVTESVRAELNVRVGLLETASADVLRAMSLSNALTATSHACFLVLVVLVSAGVDADDQAGAFGLVVVVLCTPLLIRILQTWSTVGYWMSTAAAIVESQGLKSLHAAHGAPADEVDPAPPPRPDNDLTGGWRPVVAVRDVRYRYDLTRMGATGAHALKGVSFDIGDEEFLAVLGPVGCGKSTLGLLLAGLLRPTSGSIELSPERVPGSLRRVVLVDNQDLLFRVSIADNLRMVDRSLSLKRMVEICEAVGVHEYVSEFPLGYRSMVGERGMRLSSGQRQLLSIARAIAARPAVVVLDEATSCLDSEAENRAIAGLRRELPGPVVLIAHRMSSVMLADRLIVMEDGVIVGSGSHDELTATSDLYRRYHALQGI